MIGHLVGGEHHLTALFRARTRTGVAVDDGRQGKT